MTLLSNLSDIIVDFIRNSRLIFELLLIAISLSALSGAIIAIIEIADEIRLRRLPVWVSSLRSRRRLYWSHSIRARRRQNRNPLFRRFRYIDRSYLDQLYRRDWFVRTWRLPRFSLNVIAVAASGLYAVVATPLLFVFYTRSMGGLSTTLRESFGGFGNILFGLVAALFFIIILLVIFTGSFYAHVQASKNIITNITRPLVTPPDLAAGNKWRILSFIWFFRFWLFASIVGVIVYCTMLSFGDVTLTMQGWVRSFGFLVILPSLPLMYFYRSMELLWTELSDDTDEEIVFFEEYEWARSIVEYTKTQFFRTTSWIGNVTRAGTARFFSYYWTPIALLTFPGLMEVVVPSNVFSLIVFPIIVCIFLLLASGLRNLLSMLKQKFRSYVARWTLGSEVIKETKGENGTEYNFRQALYSVFINLFIAYVIFLLGVFLIDRIPMSVMMEIDRVVLSVSQDILIVLLTVAGLPASLVETTWKIIVNMKHPGEALLFTFLVAMICLPLYVVAKNSQQTLEKIICLLLDRLNPYDRSLDSYEVVKSFKRDLFITYILFSVVPLVYLVLLLFIVSMLDAVF